MPTNEVPSSKPRRNRSTYSCWGDLTAYVPTVIRPHTISQPGKTYLRRSDEHCDTRMSRASTYLGGMHVISKLLGMPPRIDPMFINVVASVNSLPYIDKSSFIPLT